MKLVKTTVKLDYGREITVNTIISDIRIITNVV